MSEHSVFPPSSSHRWLNCHASIKEAIKAPKQEAGKAAIEGRTAHALAEKCLTLDQDAADVVAALPKAEAKQFSKAMVKHVQGFVDLVNRLKDATQSTAIIEQKVYLKQIDERLFGTSDVILYTDKSLDVIDFKYGKWKVDQEYNTQLLFYALAADRAFPSKNPREIWLHIYQPRAGEPAHRSWLTTPEVLDVFEEQVKEAVKSADLENPPYYRGEWCQFCPAEFTCPAQGPEVFWPSELVAPV